MDKRKPAKDSVQDRLLSTLITFADCKDWLKLAVSELVEPPEVYRNFKSVN